MARTYTDDAARVWGAIRFFAVCDGMGYTEANIFLDAVGLELPADGLIDADEVYEAAHTAYARLYAKPPVVVVGLDG